MNTTVNKENKVENAIATAIAAGQQIEIANQHIRQLHSDEPAFLVLPQGMELVSAEKYRPEKKTFATKFYDVDSFIDFVNTFKDERTRIWMLNGQVSCVIDFHEPDSKTAARAPGKQQADLLLKSPEETDEWFAIMKRPLSQIDFAEFLEDHLAEIERPAAAEVLEVARTLQAARSTQFKSGVRLQNGDMTLQWTEDTVTRAGSKGELEVPSELILRLRLVEGGSLASVRVGLRYRIKDGVLTFHLRPLGLQELKREYAKQLAKQITEATGINVWQGNLVY